MVPHRFSLNLFILVEIFVFKTYGLYFNFSENVFKGQICGFNHSTNASGIPKLHKPLIRKKRLDCSLSQLSENEFQDCVKTLCQYSALPEDTQSLRNPSNPGECISFDAKESEPISVAECVILEYRKVVPTYQSTCDSYTSWKMQLCFRHRATYMINRYCETDQPCRGEIKKNVASCASDDKACIEAALNPKNRFWIFILVIAILFVVIVSVGVVLLTLRTKAQKHKQMRPRAYPKRPPVEETSGIRRAPRLDALTL